MQHYLEAFLDIETTGLSLRYSEITVIGIYVFNGVDSRFIQFLGEDIKADKIMEILRGVAIIYTYNGSRFDLPFIYSRLGVNLAKLCRHHDLMYDCWRNNLYGGLKCVERQLDIHRQLSEINGFEAVRLWLKYQNEYDEDALAMLLEYNREDIMNLRMLKQKLL